MSNAIQFLETLGRSGGMIPFHDKAYADAVALLEVDHMQRQALLNRDANALSGLLGGRSKMMMQVWAPQEDAPDEHSQEDEPDDSDDGAPMDEPFER